MSFYQQHTNPQDYAEYAWSHEESDANQRYIFGGTSSGDSSDVLHSPLSPVATSYSYAPQQSQLENSPNDYSLFPADTPNVNDQQMWAFSCASTAVASQWQAQGVGDGAQFSANFPPTSNYGHNIAQHKRFTPSHGHSSHSSIGMFQPELSLSQSGYDYEENAMLSASQSVYSTMQRNDGASWQDGGNTALRGYALPISPDTSPVASTTVSRGAGMRRDRNRNLAPEDIEGILATTAFSPDGSRTCRVCGEIVMQKLRRHLNTHLVPGLRGNVCDMCRKEFSRPDALARHQYSSASCGNGHSQWAGR